eukprot:2121084-Rhodomonas_salina.1
MAQLARCPPLAPAAEPRGAFPCEGHCGLVLPDSGSELRLSRGLGAAPLQCSVAHLLMQLLSDKRGTSERKGCSGVEYGDGISGERNKPLLVVGIGSDRGVRADMERCTMPTPSSAPHPLTPPRGVLVLILSGRDDGRIRSTLSRFMACC